MTSLLCFLLGAYAVGALWIFTNAYANIGFDHRGPHWQLLAMSAAIAVFWPLIFITIIFEELWLWAWRRIGK